MDTENSELKKMRKRYESMRAECIMRGGYHPDADYPCHTGLGRSAQGIEYHLALLVDDMMLALERAYKKD